MKLHIEKSRILATFTATAICFGGAFFSIQIYKNAPRDIPHSEISEEIEPLPYFTATGEGGNNNSEGEGLEESENSENSENADELEFSGNSENSENESSDSDIGGESYSGSENGGSGNSQASGENGENGKENSAVNGDASLATDIHTSDVANSISSQKEYFSTSIKDGERVSQREYYFTVTHLDKNLKLRDCTVTLNGEVISQFSGKCLLSEGENSIRITCAYTDSEGAVVRAYKDYRVILDSGEISFKTSLKNGESDSSTFEFTAYAYLGEEEIPLTVSVNGKTIEGEGEYSAELEQGENKIVLTAKQKGKTAEKTYEVSYIQQEFGISTDLYDRTVQEENFEFYCAVVGTQNGKLTVTLNGKTIRGDSGNFSCKLNNGENTVRIIAKDGGENSITQSYTVSYVPQMSEEDLPRLTYINIYDGMEIKGAAFTLSLYGADSFGERIYSGKISVSCGGNTVKKSHEDSGETGYLLSLSAGENEISIRLTDSLRRTRDYFYTVNCTGAAQGEEIGRVQIYLDASLIGLGNICSDGDFPIYEGESGFDTVKRFLEENGFTVYTSGGSEQYISRIEKNGAFFGAYITDSAQAYMDGQGIVSNGTSSADSLGEFDFTVASGWVYKKNGKVPSYGISGAVFTDGDRVGLEFSLCFGNDIREDS